MRSRFASAPYRGQRAVEQATDPTLVYWVAAAALFWALLWVLLPAWSDVASSADNVEQLVWSQGLELGYHKHPPLPTWILIGAEQLFHPSLPLTYALSIVGLLVGAAFLWRLAADLLGPAAALPAVLATGCIAFFSYRAHIFNHNTVLVPFVYASALAFLRAVRTGKTRYWLLLGAASAAAMLTKYQFAVILATFVLIAIGLKLYRQPRAVRGACLAAGTALVLLGPHIWWLVANDFPPFKYASEMVLARLGLADRLTATGGFLLQQVRDSLVVVLMLLLASVLWWRERTASQSNVAILPQPPNDRVWILMLGFAPLALMVALGLLGGVQLENHWGTTALQFVVLPVLYWMRGRSLIPSSAAVLAVFVFVQTTEAGYDISVELRERNVTSEEGGITAFDPRSLARAVTDDWQRSTAHAKLRYVVGSTTWGGFVSLYSGDHPEVLIGGDPHASPWVSMQDLLACGAVYFEPVQPPAGADVSGRGEWTAVDLSNAHHGQPMHIRWAVVSPGSGCGHRQPAG